MVSGRRSVSFRWVRVIREAACVKRCPGGLDGVNPEGGGRSAAEDSGGWEPNPLDSGVGGG